MNGLLRDKRYLLMDRDTKYSEALRHLLEQAGMAQEVVWPNSDPRYHEGVASRRSCGVGQLEDPALPASVLR